MRTVTAFVGSARRRGLTHAATRRLLDELEALGDVQTELVFLSDYRLGVCRGCKACFSLGEERCPLRDERDLLLARMAASDGVVLASPNYSFQVSGLTKIFLDRLGFLFHRPRFHGKVMTPVVVQGIRGGERIVKYLELVGFGLGFQVVKGSCITALEPMVTRERRRMEETVARQARRFHARLSRPPHPAPSLLQLWMFRMSRTSVHRLLGDGDRDYEYYRERGWFDSAYYYPTRLGPLKRLAGASFDWMGAHAVRQREGT